MSILVIGGNSGIAQGIIEYYCRHSIPVIAVSRSVITNTHPMLTTVTLDIIHQANRFSNWLSTYVAKQRQKPEVIFNCIGLLHTKSKKPEKKLQEIDSQFLFHNMEINCYSSVVVTQILDRLYSRKDKLKVIILSAKIGSISDNTLGGWYSYRMSKAALNMLVKTVSIEWKRTHPKACIVAVHPGTTDTELSKPFQKNVPINKLYTSGVTAQRVATIVENITLEDSGKFLFWDGSLLSY